ncbi:Sensor histidine kinase DesK [Corynebacterium endometrii]|uniref:histidine kinase n=2 Tax=Corynebacterium endometrii TaxID=2488819 RepID=A0A4P7QH75_9CORY|nr:Sensor histidine kinase DesK [Corynebacterium endometrii]
MREWGITAGCAAVGLLIGIVGVSLDLDTVTGALAHAEAEDRYAVFIALMIIAGVVAAMGLPWALNHVPEEADPDYPGTRRSLTAACVVALCGFSYFAIPAALVALVSAFGRRTTLWSTAATACLAGSFAVEALLWHFATREYDPLTPLGFPVVVIPAMLIGTARGRRRERQARLEAEARLTREQMRAREDAARVAERERIARDMHDSLSHRLSLIALHAGALAYREDLPRVKAAAAAGTIRDEAQAAVNDLRQVLSALQETAPLLGVEELLEEHRAAGGRVEVAGEIPRLETLATQALARAVQEGLTNARKHAPGQPVRLEFAGGAGRVSVRMSNALPESPVAAGGSQLGLSGIAERARLNGGTFRVEDSAGGEFAWSLDLPYPSSQEGAARHG